MKIVQVTPRYYPHIGGVETQVQELSERFVKQGHDVTVLTADDSSEHSNNTTYNGVEIHRHRSFAPQGSFHIAPGLLTAISSEDADLIHAHNYHSLPALFAALANENESFFVTSYYHGKSSSAIRQLFLQSYKRIGSWALHQANEVIAVSKWEQRRLEADLGVDSTVVPIGIDVDQFREQTPLKRERPYLLCVCRLVEYKGVQHVIRALPRLEQYDLIIAGDGGYLADLKRIAVDLGVDDRVSFFGNVDSDRLPSIYAGASAYVSMSSFESYGITVAEALASRTPCVVRESTALKDWTGHAGVIGVQNIEPQSIERAVRSVISTEPNPDAVPTWTDVVDQTEELYTN